VLLRCHKILFPAYASLPCSPAGIFDYWASNLTLVSQLPIVSKTKKEEPHPIFSFILNNRI
uniref:hypothetical protein n=1 Tax=Enterocloster clostridioformis TaxID=1531 RepID=UPI0025A4FBA8